MLALGIMVPVLPKLIVQFEHGNMASAAAISGWFGFAWAAMQFVSSPVLGALSDRFGRRPIILLSNLGLGLDYVMMALAPSLPWLFVGRLVSGVTSASFPTAAAYIADVTPPEKRAAKFGMLGAAFGLGFVIGPALGGGLGAIDLRLPFWIAAGLSLANAAYGFFILPESLPAERRAAFSWSRAHPLGALRLLQSQPALLGMAIAGLCYFVAHEALPSMFVLYTDYRYHWDAARVGLVLAGIGVSSTIVSATLVGPAVKALGERRALLLGLSAGACGFLIYAFAASELVFVVGVPLIALWGLSSPSLSALMSRRVGPSAQGQLQGAIGSLRGISGMLGPPLFTQTFAYAIGAGSRMPFSGAPYLLGAMLIIAGALLAVVVTAPASDTDARVSEAP
ncbi:MAG: TCR/Tet family MFS transporter [Deltaproteobacteria bacterium]|nr:TCR/Tet family MFS transporter [Deltaproteobacteria bacterium]